jgi:RND family efflux transporter MFP subunit
MRQHRHAAGVGSLIVIVGLAGSGCGHSVAPVVPPPPGVSVAQPIAGEIVDYEEFTGRLQAVSEVEVRARVRGFVVNIAFTDGTEVKEGDVLCEIDPRPFQADVEAAQGKVAQWQAKLARAESDVERTQRLLPKGAASQKDLDNAIADRGEARAAIQTAQGELDRAKLDLEFTKVTAPIGGRIGRALVTKGNLVTPGDTLLATIVSQDPIYVYFDVDERAFLAYQKTGGGADRQTNVKDANIKVSLGLASEDGLPHEGRIDFADNRVDPSTGTIRLRAVFPNTNRVFTPGLFARVRVPLGDKYQALLVPERAIGTDQGQKYVLAVNDKNVVEYRAVKLGRLRDDLRVIQSGLAPGDTIIVAGLQRARPGATVTPQRAEASPPNPAAAEPTPAPAH